MKQIFYYRLRITQEAYDDVLRDTKGELTAAFDNQLLFGLELEMQRQGSYLIQGEPPPYKGKMIRLVDNDKGIVYSVWRFRNGDGEDSGFIGPHYEMTIWGYGSVVNKGLPEPEFVSKTKIWEGKITEPPTPITPDGLLVLGFKGDGNKTWRLMVESFWYIEVYWPRYNNHVRVSIDYNNGNGGDSGLVSKETNVQDMEGLKQLIELINIK